MTKSCFRLSFPFAVIIVGSYIPISRSLSPGSQSVSLYCHRQGYSCRNEQYKYIIYIIQDFFYLPLQIAQILAKPNVLKINTVQSTGRDVTVASLVSVYIGCLVHLYIWYFVELVFCLFDVFPSVTAEPAQLDGLGISTHAWLAHYEESACFVFRWLNSRIAREMQHPWPD